jgi:hypothetical protein
MLRPIELEVGEAPARILAECLARSTRTSAFMTMPARSRAPTPSASDPLRVFSRYSCMSLFCAVLEASSELDDSESVRVSVPEDEEYE